MYVARRATKTIRRATHMMKNHVKQRTINSTYAHAANSLLATINFNVEDIKNWAILD